MMRSSMEQTENLFNTACRLADLYRKEETSPSVEGTAKKVDLAKNLLAIHADFSSASGSLVACGSPMPLAARGNRPSSLIPPGQLQALIREKKLQPPALRPNAGLPTKACILSTGSLK